MKEKPVIVEYSSMKFLLLGLVKPGEEEGLMHELQYRAANYLVVLEDNGKVLTQQSSLSVLPIYIEKDTLPSNFQIRQWLSLVRQVFYPSHDIEMRVTRDCIAIQSEALADLPPLLVAIALIESGLENLPTIDLIRAKLPYAFSEAQLQFLTQYSPGILRNRTPQCCGYCRVF